MKKWIATLFVLLFLVNTGCTPVLQWQRQHLADPAMEPDDNMRKQFKSHIYPRLEAGPSVDGSVGGGCGC